MAAILYYVTIKSGAVAYSPDGQRNWGQISDVFRARAGVVAEGVGGDKLRIGDPLWNSREWCVKQADTALITPPPPPDPEPNTETITIAAHSVQVEINGVLWEYWYPQVTLERVV